MTNDEEVELNGRTDLEVANEIRSVVTRLVELMNYAEGRSIQVAFQINKVELTGGKRSGRKIFRDETVIQYIKDL